MARNFKIQVDPITRHSYAYLWSTRSLVTMDAFVGERGETGWMDWRNLAEPLETSYGWPNAHEIVPKVQTLWSEISRDRRSLEEGKRISGWNANDIGAREEAIACLERLLMDYLVKLAEGAPEQ